MELTTNRGARRTALRLAALALSLAPTGCGHGSAQQEGITAREAVAVRLTRVSEELVSRPIVATGSFAPKDETRLAFKIGGVIASVDVDEGSTVRAGQRLASLDLREIDAALAKARSAADKAERDLARARRLYADSVVTLSQLQDAETGWELARADLEAAAFDREFAIIVAPADGVILGRGADPGETTAPGTPVLTLGSRSRGAVLRVGLADRDVVRVAKGDSALVRFDAVADRAFRGWVTEIGAAAAPGMGTYAVEILLAGADALVAGMVGRAEIFPSERIPTAVVPVEAVLEADGDRATVFVLADDGERALRREVTVAFLDDGRVAVPQGLEGVEAVVSEGAAWLMDGDRVRVIR